MRVSDSYLSNVMMTALNSNAVKVGTLYQQLATGEKLTKASDDPVAATKLLGLESQLKSIEQYKSNAENINNDLSLYETNLNVFEDNMQRVNELMLWASNDALSFDQRQAINVELASIKDQLATTLNAKNENGSYIFSGTATDKAPILIDEDGGLSINPEINNTLKKTAISDGVYEDNNLVLTDVLGSGLGVLDQIEGAITAIATDPIDKDALKAGLDAVDQSITIVSSAVAGIGSRMNTLESYVNTAEDMGLFVTQLTDEINSLDYTEAAVRMDAYMLAIQATQKAYSNINSLSLFHEL